MSVVRYNTYSASAQGSAGEQEEETAFSRLHAVSVEQKETEEYLLYWADYFISLCGNQTRISVEKAYAQRKGMYDPFRPRRINMNFGVQSPAEVNHIPIIEPYWRRMKGTHKSTPLYFSVTSQNTEDVLSKQKEKTAHLLAALAGIEASMLEQASLGLPRQMVESLLENQYESLCNRMEHLWRSELEIQCQHVLSYLVNRCDLIDVCDDLFDDYGTCRQAIVQVKAEKIGQLPQVRALDPRNLFVSKHTHTKWMRQCDSYVYKERMLVSDVIQLYGEYLSEKDIHRIDNEAQFYWYYNDYLYTEAQTAPFQKDIDFRENGMKGRYVDVWYVEWKALNPKENIYKPVVDGPDTFGKKSYRQDRYECTRIGQSVYLRFGKSNVVVRDQDDPDKCHLTIDGLVYEGRFGHMDSLWQKCQALNDEYDVCKYLLTNYLARSGQKSSPVILEAIPKLFGTTPEERILKFYQYEKEGMSVFSSEDATAIHAMQSLGGVRDRTISRDVMVITEIMNLIEGLISRIMGPNAQSLGDVAQNDGKGTTELAIANFLLLSQDIFMDMHRIKQKMLTMLLNTFRMAFPGGFRGCYMQEGKEVFFQVDKAFSLSSYNVFLSDSGQEKALLEAFKQIAVELAKNQELDKKELLSVLSAKSLAQIQRDLYVTLDSKKNQIVESLRSQMSQMETELKSLRRQIAVNQQAENENNAKKLDLEKYKTDITQQQTQQKLEDEKQFNDQKLALDAKRVSLESQQLLLGNASNAEVRND